MKHCQGDIQDGDTLIITLKVHGTSQRTGVVLRNRELKWYERLAQKFGVAVSDTEVGYLNGTRRVVLGDKARDSNSFHGDDLRQAAAKKLEPFLEQHMVVYYEVVGYEPSGKLIMQSHDTKRSRDKELRKKYGNTMSYTYGCAEGEHDIYVYRIAWVLPNGKTVDLPWDEVKAKCNSWEIKHCPELARMWYAPSDMNSAFMDKESLIEHIGEYTKGEDPIDPRHIREGVCVRVQRPGSSEWVVMKDKNWDFKVLEGIAHLADDYYDLEEES